MKGVLLVDKPEGWTSFDVVNYVRKIVARVEDKKPKHVKVGHTGTLDPAATGLLVLCVGKEFTSQVPELMAHDKTYEAEITLGSTSTTADKEGIITPISDTVPDDETVQAALRSFIGEIEQVPPVFSAIKVDGKRAYDLARAGKAVALKPRKVTIYSIDNVVYTYPSVRFTVRVGSGTYIRSLAVDIGEKLGIGAYLSNLRRSRVGNYDVKQALAVSELTEVAIQNGLDANR